MAIESKAITQGFILISVLLVGIFMAVSVTTNATGGIAALVPLITVILSLLAIVKPQAGLYGLAALVIWVDEFKRLAVYFGGAYSITVVQVLSMPFIVLAALNISFFLNILFRKVKIDLIGVIIYGLGFLSGAVIFLTMEDSVSERAQRAANIAGYITLIPIAYTYLKTFDQWRNFFSFQVILALPSAAWAIKQYYYGFDQIELIYAASGLSMVHSGQMFLFAEPRVFGFFGSASALGCAGIYCAYSWWHSLRFSKRRVIWLIISILFTWALVASTQRSALIYPIIAITFSYVCRTKLSTIAAYSFGFLIFFTGVMTSDYLLNEGIDNINKTIASNSDWGRKVLNVNTFSDRLQGWQRLKKPEAWSIYGTGIDKYTGISEDNHDIINKILISYGIIGLIAILIPSFFVLRSLHSSVFIAHNKTLRNDTAFVLALGLPMIFLSFIGGDNFNANPINLQIWTSIAGVFSCRRQAMQARVMLKSNTPTKEDLNLVAT